jgi:hypothetical protein
MEFQSSKISKLTYSCYLDLKLDIFNIYMSKHTCMNYELSLKDIKLINMIPRYLTHKQKQLIVLL